MTKKQEAVAGLIQAAFVATCAAMFVFGVGGCSTAFTINGDAINIRQGTVEQQQPKKRQSRVRSRTPMTLAY